MIVPIPNNTFYYVDGQSITISITVVPNDPPGSCNPTSGCLFPLDYLLSYTGPNSPIPILNQVNNTDEVNYTFTIPTSSPAYGEGDFTFTVQIDGGAACNCCDPTYTFNFSTAIIAAEDCFDVSVSGAPFDECAGQAFQVGVNLSDFTVAGDCLGCARNYEYQLYKVGQGSPI
ncbi:MAG: hypothetical protein KDC44_24875, partial [Phaeodactylibacter sp.]|nr:hypothetical protein [Phaeodactylibacter sp.]